MYYYDAAAREGRSPFDEALGVTSQMSAGATRLLVKLCARLPYQEAVAVYAELARVQVGVSTAWKQVQVIGQRARPALEPIPTLKPTSAQTACMGLSMDGCMAHVRTEGWKEIKVGVVFEVAVTGQQIKPHHPDTVIPAVHAHQQSYVLHLGGPEGFGVKLVTEAQSRGWSGVDQCCVIGDGAAWIWHLATHDYARAAHIVDWYHAKQHLCAAAELLFPTAPDQAHAWLLLHEDLLYLGQADAIADRLYLAAALANPVLKATLETAAGYFADHYQRMQYQDFQKSGLPIGSGTVESAAKQTKHRLSAAGMHWSRPGLENLLPLRAALMSDSFPALWHRIGPL